MMQSSAPLNINTHIMAYELYSRKGKVMLMLQSLKRAYKIDV
jgi:peptide alpha-N-acetyltransferase